MCTQRGLAARFERHGLSSCGEEGFAARLIVQIEAGHVVVLGVETWFEAAPGDSPLALFSCLRSDAARAARLTGIPHHHRDA
jgi:hypothetical protein